MGTTPQQGRTNRKPLVRPVTKLAVSADEAAEMLSVSRDHLDRHIAHELAWVRRGRRKVVMVAELLRWLEWNQARGAA